MRRRLFIALLALLVSTGQVSAQNLHVFLDEVLQNSRLTETQFSIQVLRLATGKVLYEHDANLALNPASNMKLVTAATALRRLGPDFRFKTNFFTQTPVRQGTIQDLWIKGYGNPLFMTEDLPDVVGGLKKAGVQRIAGNIYYDDSFFDQKSVTSYQSDSRRKEYRVVSSPLAFNFGTLEVQVRPERRGGGPAIAELVPPNRYLSIINQTRTGGRHSSIQVRPLKDQVVVRGLVSARSGGGTFRQEVSSPPLYATQVIATALQEGNIEVAGEILRQAVPPDANCLYTHESPPLREVLKSLGKFSNNFAAEQLLKTLGAAESGPPGSGPPGSTEKGLGVLANYLEGLHISRGAFTLENGSGLAKETRLAAAHFIAILRDMYASPYRDDFMSSLSISGIDGTIRHRLKHGALRGEVMAKTGSLSGVIALSGYWPSAPGGAVVFSIIMNGADLSFWRAATFEEKFLTALGQQLETRP